MTSVNEPAMMVMAAILERTAEIHLRFSSMFTPIAIRRAMVITTQDKNIMVITIELAV